LRYEAYEDPTLPVPRPRRNSNARSASARSDKSWVSANKNREVDPMSRTISPGFATLAAAEDTFRKSNPVSGFFTLVLI
jgi:hypothetical protein